MPLKPDEKYIMKVSDAYMTESKEKGTPALFMEYTSADGKIDREWYITMNTVARLREDLEKCFGITQEQLSDMAFLNRIGSFLRDQECQISTKGEEYNGKSIVKVQWMNPVRSKPKKVEGAGLKRVAGLFGGGPMSSPAYRGDDLGIPPAAPWLDDETPF